MSVLFFELKFALLNFEGLGETEFTVSRKTTVKTNFT